MGALSLVSCLCIALDERLAYVLRLVTYCLQLVISLVIKLEVSLLSVVNFILSVTILLENIICWPLNKG